MSNALLKSERTTYRRLLSGGSTFFALKVQTPRQQPFLVALTNLDDPATERVVVDPDVIDPSGETTIDFFVPSPDGKQVAVSLSEHGTEDGSLHVYDVGSGEVVGEPIAHVNLMGDRWPGVTTAQGSGTPAALTPQVFSSRSGSASSVAGLTALTSLALLPTSGSRRTTCLLLLTVAG